MGARLTSEQRALLKSEAAAMYARDFNIRAIADELGLSYGLTRALLVESGVTLRPRGGAYGKVAK